MDLSCKWIIFDFDGVILDSVKIKTKAFAHALREYPKEFVDQLLVYHEENGGVSRFEKFKHFSGNILKKSVPEETINQWLRDFGHYATSSLSRKDLLIDDTLAFIQKNYEKIPMFVASGAEQTELRYICADLELEKYFKGIYGSPTAKHLLVKNIINEFSLDPKQTILIGDAKTDAHAAAENDVRFLGYNNPILKTEGFEYIESFDSFHM